MVNKREDKRMENALCRTEMLIGRKGIQKLKESRIAVFGIGGVGSYVVEALARCGVGTLDLCDPDQVCESNLNRQLIALRTTIGMDKVRAAKERIAQINGDIVVHEYKCLFEESTQGLFPFSQYDYIVDAIDMVSSKLLLIENAVRAGRPVISCMGVGNKLHPEKLEITDIYKTSMCPLAKVIRKECKMRKIKKLKVLYSSEPPRKPERNQGEGEILPGKHVPGSIAFVPSVAGLMIAGEVVRDLLKEIL